MSYMDRLGAFRFVMPLNVGGDLLWDDETLLETLKKCLLPQNQRKSTTNLLQTLNLFRYAHYEHHGVNWRTKIVLMNSAFECLLDLPEARKRKSFREAVDTLSKSDKIAIEERVEFDDRQKREVTRTYTKAAWWAYDFYKLRNDVVHTGTLAPEKFRFKDWITQLIVADVVFTLLVRKILFSEGYVSIPDAPEGDDEMDWAEIYRISAESVFVTEHFMKNLLKSLVGELPLILVKELDL